MDALDPAVYPYNLESIYPPLAADRSTEQQREVTCALQSVYPNFNICESYRERYSNIVYQRFVQIRLRTLILRYILLV